jgi:hypothetical protein
VKQVPRCAIPNGAVTWVYFFTKNVCGPYASTICRGVLSGLSEVTAALIDNRIASSDIFFELLSRKFEVFAVVSWTLNNKQVGI